MSAIFVLATGAFVLVAVDPAEAARGYQSRACGLDMNRNGIVGECSNHSSGGLGACPDCHVCDGVTADPDGDGVNEDMIYVDCQSGSDNGSCGAPGSPCRTINYALNTRADGPGDGAEDIVCFKGTCNAEPNAMGFGPDGVSTGSSRCGGNAYYSRAKRGNEVRDFRYPCNPAMVVGWDADNDGDYPPHDPNDTAVIDGTGKQRTFSGEVNGVPKHYEMAHFTAREYGRGFGADGADAGFWRVGHGSSQLVSLHDLELVNIDRQAPMPGGSTYLIFDLFNGESQHLAMENLACKDCGGFFLRGEPIDMKKNTVVGPLRFKNITWRAFGSAGGGGAMAVKVWGLVTGIEFLDSIYDMNMSAWTPGDFHYTNAMNIAQCSQNVDIINNEFIDPLAFGVRLQAASTTSGTGACDLRPVDNVNIVGNVFRATRPAPSSPSNFCCSQFAFLDSVGRGSTTNEYVNNVTIANNFFYSNAAGGKGYQAAIYSTLARNGAQIPGTVKIVNNTIHGTYDGDWYPRSAIGIQNEYGLENPQQNYVVKNNIFSGVPTTGARRVIRTYYALNNLQADFNIFDSDATFVWNNGNDLNFSSWRTQSRNDTNSTGGGTSTPRPTCEPSYVNVGNADLHLLSSDTCARGRGTDLSSIVSLDIDGDSRPRGTSWDVGGDQADAGPAPPTLLEVVPVGQ